MRLISGVTSVLVPIGLLASSIIEPLVWPQGASFFDNALLILGALGLLTIFGFIWYTLRSNAVPSEKRTLWVVVLLFVNIFALPFFWFGYVREKRQEP